MAKRQTKGVTSRKDLRTVRKQIDTRHATPATRTRGVTKAQAEFVHKLHTGKLSKSELAQASRKPAGKTTPVKAAPAFQTTEYAWTPERDRTLLDVFANRGSAIPHGLITQATVAIGFPFHVVKQRARFLGLLARKGTRQPASTTGDPDAQLRATDAERIAAETTTPTTKREKPAIVVACPKGDERLTIQRKGRRSFTVLEGAQPDHSYGIGTHGLPICPQHSVEMIAAEPIDAAEAMRQVQGTTSQQSALFELDREFNFEGAWMAIEQMDEDLDTLQDAFDLALREVKKQRKDLDTLRASRRAAVKEFKKRRIAKAAHVAERQAQTATRADARCAFEQHIGTDCPLCHATSVALAIAAVGGTETAYRDRWSEAHRATAVRANSIDAARLSDLSPAAVVRALPLAGLHGLYLADVETWTTDEVLAVLRWVEGDQASDVPAVLGLPHHAAPEGEELQACADCGAILVNLNEGGVTFPAGSLVGRFCSRTPQAPIGTEVAEAAASV